MSGEKTADDWARIALHGSGDVMGAAELLREGMDDDARVYLAHIVELAMAQAEAKGRREGEAGAETRIDNLGRHLATSEAKAHRACMEIRHAEKRAEKAETDTLAARTMVLRLVVARYRDGWEEGETEEETLQCAADQLSDWGLDPHVKADRNACKDALARNPEVSLAQMRSNQELAMSAHRECEEAEAENARLREELKQLQEAGDNAGWAYGNTRKRERDQARAESLAATTRLSDYKITSDTLCEMTKAGCDQRCAALNPKAEP